MNADSNSEGIFARERKEKRKKKRERERKRVDCTYNQLFCV